MGFLLGLWRETAPTARHQPSAACLHETTAADVKLIEELLAGAGLGEDLARRLFGDWPTGARGWRRPWLNVTTTFAAKTVAYAFLIDRRLNRPEGQGALGPKTSQHSSRE